MVRSGQADLEVTDTGAAEGGREGGPLDEIGAHGDQVQVMLLRQPPRLLLRQHLRSAGDVTCWPRAEAWLRSAWWQIGPQQTAMPCDPS